MERLQRKCTASSREVERKRDAVQERGKKHNEAARASYERGRRRATGERWRHTTMNEMIAMMSEENRH